MKENKIWFTITLYSRKQSTGFDKLNMKVRRVFCYDKHNVLNYFVVDAFAACISVFNTNGNRPVVFNFSEDLKKIMIVLMSSKECQ